mmetsp:Transcript_23906/g.36583  ORF Transcript_23906/g.36583 Transcript_23906/m.36583 type:complete len:83 (+) Transcript_23906:477-725(+)
MTRYIDLQPFIGTSRVKVLKFQDPENQVSLSREALYANHLQIIYPLHEKPIVTQALDNPNGIWIECDSKNFDLNKSTGKIQS